EQLKIEKDVDAKIKRLRERAEESRAAFRLAPGNIARAVNTALELAKFPPLEPAAVPSAKVGSVFREVPYGQAFRVPDLPGSWGRALAGLADPLTGERRPIVFDDQYVENREDLVLAHLNHPLVQMSLRLLREEIWRKDDERRDRLHRVAFRYSPLVKPGQIAVLVLSRLVIVGGDARRIHEEIITSGEVVSSGSFRRIDTQGELKSLLEDSKPYENVDTTTFEIAKNLFETNEKAIYASVVARSNERFNALRPQIEKREQREIADVKAILDDLENELKTKLNVEIPDATQASFDFVKEYERFESIKADRGAIEKRLARIPEERDLEEKAIQERYDDPQQRTFPVAVVFVVPESARK
ncbi:MAG: hypothetical protein IJM30_10175, partial [Thermoguttaceae bacterium]|nr:hypothetical protein [Thermoguttaceae bacterium]